MNHNKIGRLVAMISLMGIWSVWADGVLQPVHGGRMAEAAGYRLEMVATNDRLDLYVTNHDNQPVAVDKATGKIVLMAAQGKVEVPLSPAGENRLSGTGDATTGAHGAAVIAVEGLPKRITARLAAGH